MKTQVHKAIINFLCIALTCLFLQACANQLPPSGGEEDKTPPSVISQSPAPNTINFRGNSVKIEFNEYIDRRSFEESFFISPKPKEVRINYGGTDVEILFPEGLEPDRTYSIVITRGLQDTRGGNKLAEPIQFAFSTGSRIDKGKISGKVYALSLDRVIVEAYALNAGERVNPEKDNADYITQVDDNGSYSFNNLPRGKFRVFALRDGDRNLLYTPDFDRIAVPDGDKTVTDTVEIKNTDFIFDLPGLSSGNFKDKIYIDSLTAADTLGFLYSSLRDNSKNIAPDSRFYFYFKNNKFSRSVIADNLKLQDTSGSREIRVVYNWLSDSTLQVFPAEPLKYSESLRFIFDFGTYYRSINFKVVDESNAGVIKGLIRRSEPAASPVYVLLLRPGNYFLEYSLKIENDSAFTFSRVPEGNYYIFAFEDVNNNGAYDRGKYYPFEPAEPFTIYSNINLKGSWSLDNIFITF